VNAVGLTKGVAGLSTRVYHSCAILDDGTAMAWGSNPGGALGNGAASAHLAKPTKMPEIGKSAIAVGAAGYHSCVALKSGAVRCVGSNTYGELGNSGATNPQLKMVDVEGLGGKATAIAPGDHHTCAVVGAGVRCWGRNNAGQLGKAASPGASPKPNAVSGLPAAVASVAAGADFNCALLVNGQVWCWGDNSYGQLGDGTKDASKPIPVQVKGLW